jgi:hypothetical protein
MVSCYYSVNKTFPSSCTEWQTLTQGVSHAADWPQNDSSEES